LHLKPAVRENERCSVSLGFILQDLRTGTYEGAQSRSEKEALYRRGVELLSPIAIAILEEANALFLLDTGDIKVIGPEDDGFGMRLQVWQTRRKKPTQTLPN
jgi:hypothetical protein